MTNFCSILAVTSRDSSHEDPNVYWLGKPSIDHLYQRNISYVNSCLIKLRLLVLIGKIVNRCSCRSSKSWDERGITTSCFPFLTWCSLNSVGLIPCCSDKSISHVAFCWIVNFQRIFDAYPSKAWRQFHTITLPIC